MNNHSLLTIHRKLQIQRNSMRKGKWPKMNIAESFSRVEITFNFIDVFYFWIINVRLKYKNPYYIRNQWFQTSSFSFFLDKKRNKKSRNFQGECFAPWDFLCFMLFSLSEKSNSAWKLTFRYGNPKAPNLTFLKI